MAIKILSPYESEDVNEEKGWYKRQYLLGLRYTQNLTTSLPASTIFHLACQIVQMLVTSTSKNNRDLRNRDDLQLRLSRLLGVSSVAMPLYSRGKGTYYLLLVMVWYMET
jgi:hypothetical protein